MTPSKLTSALTAALEDPRSAAKHIASVSSEEIETADEAALVVQLLQRFSIAPAAGSRSRAVLRQAAVWLQRAESDEANKVFRTSGAPELLRIFDDLVASGPDGEFDDADDLLFLLKVASLFGPSGGVERLVRAAQSPKLHDGFLWSTLFEIVTQDKHPWRAPLLDALRDPLPGGFAAVAYLDFANTLARAGNLAAHPFDTTAGRVQLEAWLTDPDEGRNSYAHSAAASIPFLSPEARKVFLQLADAHRDHNVRFEAAWGAALRGDEQGLDTLQAACADPRHAPRAMGYLRELGAADRIPVEATSPDFQALAEMCTWLAHPNEYGRPPSEIRQVDSRELFWPPTGDRRQLRVFRFEYPPRDEGDEVDVGHGMVGSVTFALAGENTAALSAEAIYGLHCAWELAMNHDDRAPTQRTAEAGVEILRTYNHDFIRG